MCHYYSINMDDWKSFNIIERCVIICGNFLENYFGVNLEERRAKVTNNEW